jgi:hypothetical protein
MSDLRLLAILENIDKLEGAVSDEFLRNLCKEAAKEIAELNALRLRQKQELVAVVVDVYDTPGLLWFCQHPLKRGDRLYTAPQPTARREWQELTDEQIDSACLSYRHDFGLLSVSEQDYIRFQAKEWAAALAKVRSE